MRLTVLNAYGYDCYPFKGTVPVRVLVDHPLFYVLEVLPHANGAGVSKPYKITVDKREIGRNVSIE